jgi:hypothetical protein
MVSGLCAGIWTDGVGENAGGGGGGAGGAAVGITQSVGFGGAAVSQSGAAGACGAGTRPSATRRGSISSVIRSPGEAAFVG